MVFITVIGVDYIIILLLAIIIILTLTSATNCLLCDRVVGALKMYSQHN
jgi:hypothetical protein